MNCHCTSCSHRKTIINENQDTELHWLVSCENATLSSVRKLLKTEDPNIQNARCETPLHVAALNDNSEIVTELINAGAKVQTLDLSLDTPLHISVLHCNRKVTEVLLQSGADVNSGDILGYKPLHFAVKSWFYKNPEVELKHRDKFFVEKLILAGADVNCCNLFHETPLFQAVGTGNFDIVLELLKSGANTNICDADSISCLHVALRKLHPNHKIIEELVKHGADINSKDTWFRTPLHFAILRHLDDPLDELKIATELVKVGILVHPGESIDTGLIEEESVINALSEFQNECSTAVREMKAVRITEYISLYDFALSGMNCSVFTCNKLADKMRSNVLLALLKGNYAVYTDTIESYLPKLYLKEVLMNISIFTSSENNERKIELSKDVVWLICDYLNQTEMIRLIKASSIVVSNFLGEIKT